MRNAWISKFTEKSLTMHAAALILLIDSRIPVECSSPGWVESPYDISVLLGGYVYFNCRSSMTHSNITWLYEGRRELTTASSKVMIFNRNSSLRFGPVGYDNDGLSIGCEVTTEFGKLPSSLGRITVKSEWLDMCVVTVLYSGPYLICQ